MFTLVMGLATLGSGPARVERGRREDLAGSLDVTATSFHVLGDTLPTRVRKTNLNKIFVFAETLRGSIYSYLRNTVKV